jgi:hypothetical protein
LFERALISDQRLALRVSDAIAPKSQRTTQRGGDS